MKLIFVYNANSGLFNSLTDSIHKIVSHSTHQCKLCSITFGTLKMKKDWKQFIENLSFPVEFLHKDEFLKQYNLKTSFPSVFIKEDKLKLLITSNEINNCKTLKDLKNLILSKIK
jgi:hypothetical protein